MSQGDGVFVMDAAMARHTEVRVPIINQYPHMLDQMRPEQLGGGTALLVLESTAGPLEVERLLHVRPREVAVEGAIRRAVPGVASSHTVKGRFERDIQF